VGRYLFQGLNTSQTPAIPYFWLLGLVQRMTHREHNTSRINVYLLQENAAKWGILDSLAGTMGM